VVLKLVLPPADSDSAREAYQTMAKAFDFNPRTDKKE
jgi:curved DNA-binding protein